MRLEWLVGGAKCWNTNEMQRPATTLAVLRSLPLYIDAALATLLTAIEGEGCGACHARILKGSVLFSLAGQPYFSLFPKPQTLNSKAFYFR